MIKPGDQSDQDKKNLSIKAGIKKTGKGMRDDPHVQQPSPPRKPMSSYFIYQLEMRDKLGKKASDATNKEILKQIAETWKSLSEKERRKYEERSEDAKHEYDEKLKEFESKWGTPATKKRKGTEESEKLSVGKSSKKTKVSGKKSRDRDMEEEKPKEFKSRRPEEEEISGYAKRKERGEQRNAKE